MPDWYFSLQRATWKHRLWALVFIAVMLCGVVNEWANLHDDLAISRWIARAMVVGAILCIPGCLVVLLAGRVPRSFASAPGSLDKTLPEIHADIRREHAQRERNSRRF